LAKHFHKPVDSVPETFPEAKKRQQVTQAKPGEGKVGGGNLSTTETTNGKSRDKVGERVGAG
jgi:hypothetical protein